MNVNDPDKDAPVNPDPTGHYGPGYGDPTVDAPADANTKTDTDPDAVPADPASPLQSEDVGTRPPDHLPDSVTPASENAGLIFERS